MSGTLLAYGDKVIGVVAKSSGYVSITADGVKTWTTLLNELYALIDRSKLTPYSKMEQGGYIYSISAILTSNIAFGCAVGSCLYVRNLASSSSFYRQFQYSNATLNDLSSAVPPASTVIKIIY